MEPSTTPRVESQPESSALTLLTRLAVPALILTFAVGYYVSISDLNFYARIVPSIALGALSLTTTGAAVRELRDFRRTRRARPIDAAEPPAPVSTIEPPAAGSADEPVDRESRRGIAARAKHLLDSHPGRASALFLLTVLLVISIRQIGFYTSATIYLALAFLVLRVRLWPTLPLLVVGLSAAIYLIFDVVIQVRWPIITPLP